MLLRPPKKFGSVAKNKGYQGRDPGGVGVVKTVDFAGQSKISQGIKKNFLQRRNATSELRKEPV